MTPGLEEPVALPRYSVSACVLFERLAHGWGQRLGRDGLLVMKATAKAKRHSKEQGGTDKFTYVHVKSPF